mgnify:FL=1|jgi:ribonucrease Y
MGDLIVNIVFGVAGVLGGVFVAVFVFGKNKTYDFERKRREGEEIVQKSKEEAEEILNETKRHTERISKDNEEDFSIKEERQKKQDLSLNLKQSILDKKTNKIKESKLKMASYQEDTQGAEEAIKRGEKDFINKLTEKTGVNEGSIKENILQKYTTVLEEENKKKILSIEEGLKESANKKAKKILVGIIQRLSSPTSVESRSVLIKVPKDSVKGKIVGKNGANIRHFEEKLDAAIVFNDLPNTISISAFNLVQRRIAEKAIKLLTRQRGGIDKGVVDKMIKKATEETDRELYELGKSALKKMGIKSDNKEFIRVVGRLQYRTSYGQNIMKHSMEVGWVAQMLGSELGLDVEVCKVAGFLHDLGKAIDQDPEIQETHDKLSKELMEKYGFSKEEVHAAWTHHDAAPQETPEALIVKAADSVSGGRPGARQDTLERYIEKMKAIDETVKSFDGIKKSFAMSAGREVRVYVDPDSIEDQKLEPMAQDIARKIENNVVYPGKIRINVIRRTKITEIAK